MAQNEIIIQGTVKGVKRWDSGYAVVRLNARKSKNHSFRGEVTIVGDIAFLSEGMSISARVVEKEHPKYGLQLQAVEVHESGFANVEGLVNYLASKTFKGIGKAYARTIVSYFQALVDDPEDTQQILTLIDSNPQAILKVPMLPANVAQELSEIWSEKRKDDQNIAEIMSFGLSHKLAIKVHKYFGPDAVDIIKTNFYELTKVPSVGFITADEIALRNGVARNSTQRISAAIIYVMEQAQMNGHCFLNMQKIAQEVVKMVGTDCSLLKIEDCAKNLSSIGEIIIRDTRVYLTGVWYAEQNVAQKITEMLQSPPKSFVVDRDDFEKILAPIAAHHKIDFADKQKDALYLMLTSNVCIITGGPGTGKALADDVVIPTPNGHTKMGDLKTGDFVIGSDGLPTKVLGVYPQGVKPIYKVSFEDGTSTLCSGDHLWGVCDENEGHKSINYRVITTEEIKQRLEDSGTMCHISVPLVKPIQYSRQVNAELDPYLLGLLLGNGELAQDKLKFTISDNHFKVVLESLKKWNLMECSPCEKFVPDEYMFVSPEDRWSLVQGLMDADGTFDGCCNFKTCSRVLADQFLTLVRSFGFKAVMEVIREHYEDKEHLSWRITFDTTKDFVPFRLSRKISMWKPLTKYKPFKVILSIENAGAASCTCIKVEAKDELFCANDFILTHNTTITKCAIELFEHFGVKFDLCSPTGMAAERLAQATTRPAKTIHRLLEFTPQFNGFSRNEASPLASDCVVVDETSMVDLFLFRSLTAAIRSSSKLILIGDADQLPSVGAGNILRDLIASGTVPCVRLDVIFRQAKGSEITLAAWDMLHGKVPELPSPRESNGRNFMFVSAEDPEVLKSHVSFLITKTLASPKLGFNWEQIQILTPMRGRGLGVDDLNPMLQKLLNPASPEKAEIIDGFKVFRVGDRVMQTRNDYDKDVFNGFIGKIVGIVRNADSVSLYVKFQNREEYVEYIDDERDDLQLAYAQTIHKAQGGEYPVVILVIHPSQYVMLKRNLIYTGLTRARKLCIVIGTENAIETAVNNNEELKRNTTLKQLLQSANPKNTID